MLSLNREELRELRVMACMDRSTVEISDFADKLTRYLLSHDYDKEPIVTISIPKRTLVKYAGYANNWDDEDALGKKLKEELANREKKKR